MWIEIKKESYSPSFLSSFVNTFDLLFKTDSYTFNPLVSISGTSIPNDKRHIFYNKILSYVETESPTIYSLLSQGNPIESKGATLIVAIPEHIYDMVQSDKRISALIASAIPRFTKNKDVAIQFQKAVEGNVIDKLKTRLQATEVDESSL